MSVLSSAVYDKVLKCINLLSLQFEEQSLQREGSLNLLVESVKDVDREVGKRLIGLDKQDMQKQTKLQTLKMHNRTLTQEISERFDSKDGVEGLRASLKVLSRQHDLLKKGTQNICQGALKSLEEMIDSAKSDLQKGIMAYDQQWKAIENNLKTQIKQVTDKVEPPCLSQLTIQIQSLARQCAEGIEELRERRKTKNREFLDLLSQIVNKLKEQ